MLKEHRLVLEEGQVLRAQSAHLGVRAKVFVTVRVRPNKHLAASLSVQLADRKNAKLPIHAQRGSETDIPNR